MTEYESYSYSQKCFLFNFLFGPDIQIGVETEQLEWYIHFKATGKMLNFQPKVNKMLIYSTNYDNDDDAMMTGIAQLCFKSNTLYVNQNRMENSSRYFTEHTSLC